MRGFVGEGFIPSRAVASNDRFPSAPMFSESSGGVGREFGIASNAVANLITQPVGTSPDVIPTEDRPKPAICHLDRGPKGPEWRDLWSEETARFRTGPIDSSARSLRSLGRNDMEAGHIRVGDRIWVVDGEFGIRNEELGIPTHPYVFLGYRNILPS